MFGTFYGPADEALSTLTIEDMQDRIRHGAPMTGMVSFEEDDELEAGSTEEEQVITGKTLTPAQLSKFAE